MPNMNSLSFCQSRTQKPTWNSGSPFFSFDEIPTDAEHCRTRGLLRLSLIPILETENDTAAEQRKEPRICSSSSFQTESLISQTYMLNENFVKLFQSWSRHVNVYLTPELCWSCLNYAWCKLHEKQRVIKMYHRFLKPNFYWFYRTLEKLKI